MAQELPFARKQQLAAGLLKAMGILHLAKGAWVAALIGREIAAVAVVIGLAHVGIALLSRGLARLALRRPTAAALALVALLVGLQVNSLPRHSSMDLSTAGMLGMGSLQILPHWLGLLALALLLGNPDGFWTRWTRSWGRWKSWMEGLMVMLLLLLSVELGLRQIGIVPGVVQRNPYLTPVTQLQAYHAYWTDVHGIYAVSPAARRSLKEYLARPDSERPWPQHLVGEVGWVWEEHRALLRRQLETPFSKHLDSLRQLPPGRLDAVDSAYLDLLHSPVNADGFRSIPFQSHQTAKTKVLLLGDSFTWGHSATHLGNSFADLLATRGYAVYNSGISATDPAQYEAVARQFIPVIRPDFVVVNLYLGNDLVYFDRAVRPFQSPVYCTNAGALMAFPGPEWLPSPQAAHDFVVAEGRIPATDSLLFNRICSHSILGTMAWKALSGLGLIPFVRTNREYWRRSAPEISDSTTTGAHIRSIQAICDAHQAQLMYAVIPQYPEEAQRGYRLPATYDAALLGFDYQMPRHVTAGDYVSRGGHFNDAGHQKYATWLDSLIREKAATHTGN